MRQRAEDQFWLSTMMGAVIDVLVIDEHALKNEWRVDAAFPGVTLEGYWQASADADGRVHATVPVQGAIAALSVDRLDAFKQLLHRTEHTLVVKLDAEGARMDLDQFGDEVSDLEREALRSLRRLLDAVRVTALHGLLASEGLLEVERER